MKRLIEDGIFYDGVRGEKMPMAGVAPYYNRGDEKKLETHGVIGLVGKGTMADLENAFRVVQEHPVVTGPNGILGNSGGK